MALVISRKPGQTFTIGNDILITVVRVSGQKVTVTVDAPKSIPVFRSEILKRKANVNPTTKYK